MGHLKSAKEGTKEDAEVDETACLRASRTASASSRPPLPRGPGGPEDRRPSEGLSLLKCGVINQPPSANKYNLSQSHARSRTCCVSYLEYAMLLLEGPFEAATNCETETWKSLSIESVIRALPCFSRRLSL